MMQPSECFWRFMANERERTGGVDTVLIGDDLPKLGADLVAGLASLNVNEFALWVGKREGSKVE